MTGCNKGNNLRAVQQDKKRAVRGNMAGKTVTRADLAESVFRKVGLSRTESAELVETVIDEICNAITRGEVVKLSSFATFQIREKNERIGRNPKTGEEVPISPRCVMTFKASNVLKQRILKAHSARKAKQKTQKTSV